MLFKGKKKKKLGSFCFLFENFYRPLKNTLTSIKHEMDPICNLWQQFCLVVIKYK